MAPGGISIRLHVPANPPTGSLLMYRLYSPTEGLFDGTLALPDVELT